MFWYNLVYTPLKRNYSFAVIPGALCGAFPPMIGWLAAGGNLLDPQIVVICTFFFVAQIPHFWLLLIIYSSDYKRGGFKVLNDIFSETQLKRITFIWLTATLMMALLLPVFGIIVYGFMVWVLILISIVVIILAVVGLTKKNALGVKKLFVQLNIYFLIVIIIVVVDRLLQDVYL